MKKVFVALILLFFSVCLCFAATPAKKQIKTGNLLYNKEQFPEALKHYEDALLKSPDSDIVNFDLGNALYKIKDYVKAITHFEKSLLTQDKSLEQNASYNLGNTKYKYGISKEDSDLEGAINLLKQSLRHYERALELDPSDQDAQYNYEFVKKELERLEKKLKQKPQEQKQQSSPQQQKQDKKESPEKDKSEQQKSQEQNAESENKQQDISPQEKESPHGEPQGKQDQQKASPEPKQEGGSAQGAQGEMSDKQAEMALDNYRQEEEPKGLYKEKIPVHELPETQKDW
jgi:Ca-activated chloride channel family protein